MPVDTETYHVKESCDEKHPQGLQNPAAEYLRHVIGFRMQPITMIIVGVVVYLY